jgi:hypothetical protein
MKSRVEHRQADFLVPYIWPFTALSTCAVGEDDKIIQNFSIHG